MQSFAATARANEPLDLDPPVELPEMQPAKVETSGNTIWETGDGAVWERDLLSLFVRNQLRVALALPLMAAVLSLVSLTWTDWSIAFAWLGCALGCQGVQLYFCRLYETANYSDTRSSEWVGILAACEFFCAMCWSLPLYTFWQDGNEFQHIFLIASLMTIVVIRIMIASNFMPIVIAGTGVIVMNIAVKCMLAGEPLHVALGAVAVVAEIFLIQLARRLQAATRESLIFKAQRERLITELEAARDQADEAREKAEHANKAKSRFLATMSHELRTPLNAIMGFSEVLSREMMGPHSVKAYKDYSSDIHNSGDYLLNLINDILDLSRIEAGRHELQEEPVNLADVAQDCLKLVALRTTQRGQTIHTHFPETLPKVFGDRRALRQIWLNLISNAVKFTPDGGQITLRICMMKSHSLLMTVCDNGPGIPQEEVSTAMAAFSRGTNAQRKAIDGAGLGLAIVRGLVELHDGTLRINSGPNTGTEIAVTFPPKRVLEGTRAEVLAAQKVGSRSQKRLIAVTA